MPTPTRLLMDGFPLINRTDKGVEIRCQYMCAWADVAAVRDGYLWTYYLGTYAVCLNSSSAPFGDSVNGVYEYGLVDVQWSTMQGIDPTTLISERIEPTGELLTQDYRNFRWGSATGPELQPDEAPGKIQRGLNYIVTKYNMTSIPAGALSLIDCVNDAAVEPTSPGLSAWVFDIETLLFNPPRMERCLNTAGEGLWNITYSYTYRPNWDYTNPLVPVARGWNWFWRAATKKFEQIYSIETGLVHKNYPPADLTIV
jgi:hypothetical protein